MFIQPKWEKMEHNYKSQIEQKTNTINVKLYCFQNFPKKISLKYLEPVSLDFFGIKKHVTTYKFMITRSDNIIIIYFRASFVHL